MTDRWTKYRYCFKCEQTIPFDEWAVSKNYQFTVINKCSSCGHQTDGAQPVYVVLMPIGICTLAWSLCERYSNGELASSSALLLSTVILFHGYLLATMVKKHKIMKSIYRNKLATTLKNHES